MKTCLQTYLFFFGVVVGMSSALKYADAGKGRARTTEKCVSQRSSEKS